VIASIETERQELPALVDAQHSLADEARDLRARAPHDDGSGSVPAGQGTIRQRGLEGFLQDGQVRELGHGGRC
jgi:hypothetical protein